MSRPWTESQRRAIGSRGRDLLVSAGAGAGKTATLVERIASRIADPTAPVSIEDFLVVTFTRAASEEMRGRIASRLGELAGDAGRSELERARLDRERHLVQRARISTIHSWCLDLVTANAVRLGLPPAFDIADEGEDAMLRHDLVVARVEAALSDDGLSGQAARVLDALDSLGEPRGLAALVLRSVGFLESLPDAESFVARCCAEWDEAANAGDAWRESALGRRIVRIREGHAARAREMVSELVAAVPLGPATPSRTRFVAVLGDLAAALQNEGSPAPALDRKDATFTAARGADDPLRDLLKAVRDDLLAALSTMAAIDAITAESYFAPRAATARFLLRDMALGVMEDHRAEAIRGRRLAYSHLERFALQLLAKGSEASPGSAVEVLVDEFQDVNPLQAALFEAIAARMSPSPTRFSVGDVKQSIYGFREAAPELFGAMLDGADPGLGEGRAGRIALRENFRSAPRLLSEFNAIFSDLFSRGVGGVDYGEMHAFVPGVPPGGADAAMPMSLTVLFPDVADGDDAGDDALGECGIVAREIAALQRPWGDIVVLLRRRGASLAQMGAALDAAGIPWVADGASGLLDSPEIHEVLALLRAVHNPHDEIALLGALRGPAADLDARALLAISRSGGGPWVERIESPGGCPLGTRGVLEVFSARLRRWQEESMRMPMAGFVSLLYDELDLEARAAVRPAGDRRLRHLAAFHGLAAEFDGFARRGLGAFLRYVDESAKSGQTLSEVPADSDAVRILTMHQSKGCEFPIVVVPLLGTKFNEGDLHGRMLLDRGHGAAIAALEAGEDAVDPLLEEMKRVRRRALLGEELRLLYVALTRAKERVLAFGASRRSFAKWAAGEVVDLHGGALSDPDRERAQCMLDWVLMHVVRRFAAQVDGASLPVLAADGGMELSLLGSAHAGDVAIPPGPRAAVASARELAAMAARAAATVASLAIPSAPRIRAKVSVSEVKRAHDPRVNRPPTIAEPASGVPFSWRPPRDPAVPTAAAVGTATHRFLAACSFDEIARGRSLRAEAGHLVASGVLSEADSQLVLFDEVAAFLSGGIGASLLAQGATARREVPFTVGIKPEDLVRDGTASSVGPVILQGVVDLYFRLPDGGIVVIDFKTDHCGRDGERVMDLARLYEPQLILYRAALERVLGETLAGAHLVFLRGARTIEVPRRGLAGEELARLLAPVAVAAESPDERPFREPG